MANYIGNEPRYQNSQRDYFAGTGSQTVYTLTYTPGGANGILVAISGVIQKPSVAYYVVGRLLLSLKPPLCQTQGKSITLKLSTYKSLVTYWLQTGKLLVQQTQAALT